MAIQSLIAAFVISFLGSLPLGNLNVITADIAARQSVSFALRFALGVVLVEMAYLAITFRVIDWLFAHTSQLRWLQLISIVLFMMLAVGYFRAMSIESSYSSQIPAIRMVRKPFLQGLALSAINPLQLPFWAGWIGTCRNNGFLQNDFFTKILFITGAGFGTSFALAIFIAGGRALSKAMGQHRKVTNAVFGIMMLLLATWQILRAVRTDCLSTEPIRSESKQPLITQSHF